MEVDILADKQYMTGLLNQDVPIGKGTMIEYVVLTTLGDCVKESFNFPYDLTSKKLGEINVKSSSRIVSKNGGEWSFSKRPDSYIPDYYVCVGLNTEYTKIIHVWKVPGDERVVGTHGIHIIDNLKGLKKFSKYEVDSEPYDKVYQSIDFTSFPEFENINNDAFKDNMSIAKSIREGVSFDDIEKEYGEGYYKKYLKWVLDNNLKKYFHIKTGLVGIFPGTLFTDMTEFKFPVFDITGKYKGYVNVDQFIEHRESTHIGINEDPVKLVWNAVRELSEAGDIINIEDVRCKSRIKNAETYLSWMVQYGDLCKLSPTEFTPKLKELPEMCITERARIVREAFKNLAKLNRRISLKQVIEVTGFDNIETEISFIKKRGFVIQVNPDEFIWG